MIAHENSFPGSVYKIGLYFQGRGRVWQVGKQLSNVFLLGNRKDGEFVPSAQHTNTT